MEKAKAAVGNFLSKDGKHDTTVHETINPAVQHEDVKSTQHQNATKVVDREVHQDHHHTSVQPIHHREVLPEEHHHQMGDVEHKHIKHGNDDDIKQRLGAERAQFKDTRTVADTEHTTSANPTVAGEHIHHHVHEQIQPVVHKETIQPSVVHSTIPVHEVHHNGAKHHNATSLPAVTMDEFNRQGGSLGGREMRTDAFEGEPKAVGRTLGGPGAHGSTSVTENSNAAGGMQGNAHGDTLGHTRGNTNTQGHGNGNPGLMAKLNPKKDADGDGKAGFMS
ncbi:hypothetical protein B7494_g4880 [Chlorociboria aeruginascens]|nr:hypothetical protein B7494_g4880 [Chlorociboria aeruginascens]